jgi:hypothetical protein
MANGSRMRRSSTSRAAVRAHRAVRNGTFVVKHLRYRRDLRILGCYLPMTNGTTRFDEINAQLNELAGKLKGSTHVSERRILLKQFRALLDEADRLTSSENSLHKLSAQS